VRTVEKIFKYRPLNLNTINSLINNQLYFSPPSEFNDPFDAKIYYREISTFAEAEIYYRNAHQMGQIGPNEVDQMLRLLAEARKQGIPEKEFLREGNHYPKPRNAEMLICCFSQSYDNIQMWGLYSENHSGVCLGFRVVDFPPDPEKRAMVFNTNAQTRKPNEPEQLILPVVKVDYRRKPIAAAELIRIGDIQAKYESFLKTKERNWGYEKEWRCLAGPAEGTARLFDYPEASLSDVHFGSRCTSKSVETVIRLFEGKENIEKVSFWHMKESEKEYRLIRERIDVFPSKKVVRRTS